MTVSSGGVPSGSRTALVLYGSETGNSQDAADQLRGMIERLRFLTDMAEMDSVDLVCDVQDTDQEDVLTAEIEQAGTIYNCDLYCLYHRTRRLSK